VPEPPLSPWAAWPQHSRGRRHPQASAAPRNEHQRDRDRIVHSAAFRRLVYKTQVFVNHEGDLFRTRLTHSLEVAQVARSAARELQLNEDLVEAIALAHDLGHTPFGHAGQDALHECTAAIGGFEHNLQSLRVVDVLEQRYLAFDGLNLTFETREGILKHCSRRNASRLVGLEPEGPAARFVHGGQPSLEAQLVNLADEVAYCTHDIDDGLRSGLLQVDDVAQVPLVARVFDQARRAAAQVAAGAHAAEPSSRVRHEALRQLLAALINDLVAQTRANLQATAPADIEAVRRAPPLVGFSAEVRTSLDQLKSQLFRSLYRHPRVLETTAAARRVVTELFDLYTQRPAEMPASFAVADAPAQPQRAVADYIAGMTDRFASREHQRLTGRQAFAPAG
jgi:dGTPase